MMQREPWPTEVARTVGREIRRRREGRFSAQGLADAVTTIGMPYTRSQVANLEAGRRDAITVGELMAFAEVLGVPPLLLIFPVGRQATTEVVPGRDLETWAAARWFTGEDRGDGAEPLDLRRWHDRYVDDHRGATTKVQMAQRRADEVDDEEEREVLTRRVKYARDELDRLERDLAYNRHVTRELGLEPERLPDHLAHIDERPEAQQ